MLLDFIVYCKEAVYCKTSSMRIRMDIKFTENRRYKGIIKSEIFKLISNVHYRNLWFFGGRGGHQQTLHVILKILFELSLFLE